MECTRSHALIDQGKAGWTAPRSAFALVVCEGTIPMDTPQVVLQGSSMEKWNGQICGDVARLLDSKPSFAVSDIMLVGGVHVEVLTPIEKACTRVVILGVGREAIPYMTSPESDAGGFILPPFELQALVQVLKRVAGNERSRRESQPMRGCA